MPQPMRDRADVENALSHFEEMLRDPIPYHVADETVLVVQRVRDVLLWVLQRERDTTFGELIHDLDVVRAKFLSSRIN